MPWILLHIARTRSRELFVLVALMAAVGTALRLGRRCSASRSRWGPF